ncbi:MAG TPA: hydantoinase/oxoprolinase family protein, partial [Baekduia sp.]|nr:hydantoinase/oxoprolinase family protein [Baekduia sp.]
MPEPDLRLGIDVGGTNTDAVVLDRDDRVVDKAKLATTADVMTGVSEAIAAATEALGEDRSRITHVMLGTTHVTNAVLARRDLKRVAVLRIGGPATRSVPPLATWPADLRNVATVGAEVVEGGFELDGTEIAPFDADATARLFASVAGTADSVAITSVFAAVSEQHELAAAEIARAEMGEVHVSLSHEIGTLGLIERENATILNAALVGLADQIATALGDALAAHDLTPAAFLAQNDGTLMSLAHALRFPVLTIGSGPANSMRGAAHLSGTADALIADVGGTSTEIGTVVGGFPSESNDVIGLGGVRTNFRMPDVVVIQVGGGTVIGDGERGARVGPDSVGYRLANAALVFGGATATLTDAAVGAGRAALGDATRIDGKAPMLASGLARSDVLLADAIDRAKIVRGEPPLIVVGGASFLVPDNLPGVSSV